MKKLVPEDYKSESGLFKINDTYIPMSIAKTIRFNEEEGDRESIFNWKIRDEDPILFMFNPFTNLLLLGTGSLYGSLYDNNVVYERGNYFSDFIKGAMFSGIDEKRPNKIVFTFSVIEDMQDELKSQIIVKTLEMFKRNGALEDTMIKMYKNKQWSLKYFLKTKVMW